MEISVITFTIIKTVTPLTDKGRVTPVSGFFLPFYDMLNGYHRRVYI